MWKDEFLTAIAADHFCRQASSAALVPFGEEDVITRTGAETATKTSATSPFFQWRVRNPTASASFATAWAISSGLFARRAVEVIGLPASDGLFEDLLDVIAFGIGPDFHRGVRTGEVFPGLNLPAEEPAHLIGRELMDRVLRIDDDQHVLGSDPEGGRGQIDRLPDADGQIGVRIQVFPEALFSIDRHVPRTGHQAGEPHLG